MRYEIKIKGRTIAESDWPPMAQAAWARATSDREASQNGDFAELWRDGVMLARVRPRKEGHAWPDPAEKACDLGTVAKAILLMVSRESGWTAKDLAAVMSDFGLPTTRARIDSIVHGRRPTTAAEIVVMLYAIMALED